MKKIVSIISIFLMFSFMFFTSTSFAAQLDTIDITTDKQTVHPGEEVSVMIQFGQALGAYTFDIAYDQNLLEYVSVDGGTANDTGTKVRAYFFDATGGSNPREYMKMTFRAKSNIITSNPTDLSITAEGLANPDASVQYDDITVPIIKNIVVEPQYEDYDIQLNYTGDIQIEEEKEMQLIIASAMGKPYEHTRIIAEATTPQGGSVKLLGTDNQNLEHDIIQSGWGDADGDSIGGKDVKKELSLRGVFSHAGTYQIKIALIDRDNSDAEIASKTFSVTVSEKQTVTPPTTPSVPGETTPPENNVVENTQAPSTTAPSQENIQTPTTLPKTGHNIYWYMVPILVVLMASMWLLRKKD